MFQLLFFLTIGLLLLAFIVALALQGRAPGGGEALIEARQALESLQTELLPPEFVERIFARSDLDFVRAQSLPGVEGLFLNERRRIALIWVSRVREQIRLLRRLHLGSARYYSKLSVRTEITLACDFAILLIGCRALQLIFVTVGPDTGAAFAGNIAAVAGRVCDVSRESLAFLSSSKLSSAPSTPTEN